MILVEVWPFLPALTRLSSLPFWGRAGMVFAMVLPVGMLLGVFMPHGLEQLKRAGASAFIPWAWGINGIFSVLAPVLAIALSISWGSNALLLSAIPAYLSAAFTLELSE